MRYKAHLTGGVIASIGLTNYIFNTYNIEDALLLSAIGVGATLLGSVLPDLDEEGTYISNRCPISFHKLFKHRQITHYPLIATVFYFLIKTLVMPQPSISIINSIKLVMLNGLFIGILSHYILDTPEGIAWLYPIYKKNIFKLKYKNYKTRRNIKRISIILIIIFLFLKY